jgi:predicted transcriptional regulator
MKSKTMTVEFKSLEAMKNDLLALPKSKKAEIQPKDVIYFDSLGSFRNFMTIQKLEVLTLIASAKPKSVYELAKMLGRAIAPVQKDCQSLAAAGFIEFDKEKGGRGTLTPKLIFNYDRILVMLPAHPYELQFSSAA